MRRRPLSDAEYRWFSDWLVEEYGLRFGPEKRDILRSRLEPRRAELGFETFEQLYFHLKYHPERERERQRLIPYLTNNESYFFRETPQLDVLRDHVLPELRARGAGDSAGGEVRLLSAGCASGEEPYTLAMIAADSHLFPPPWKVRVTGIDLDPEALDRARAAVYTANAFRRLDDSTRARHFSPDGSDRWRLDEEIRERVRFEPANLADGEWVRRLPAQDVIFCRNVLIYFSDEATSTAVEGLYDALRPGGYLFLGHAETLRRIPTRFVAIRRPGAVFYQKPEVEGG